MEQKGTNNERRVDDNHHQTGGDQQQQQQQQAAAMMMFAELRQEIGKIDVYAETIELTYHLRKFGELFRRRITTEQQLNDLFLHLNEAALADSGFAIQFALVFASRQLGDVPIGGTNVRNAMITTLQHNFLAIERLKQEGGERFHNSIILLGEYYNRKMVGHGCRIKILGQSLLLLLTSELEQEINRICQQPASAHRLDPKFAKVLLQQITLNGTVWKEVHQKEANDLLYTMRKALIVIPNLCAPAKAFLLMALDLYSGSLGNELLDKLYGKYLTEPSKEAEQVAVNGGTSNGPTDPPSAHNQSAVNGEKGVEKQAKKDSQKDTAVQQKPKGSKSNAPSGRSTGGGKAANQNLTTNDKENKRRTTQTTKAAPAAQKTSPKASTGRSIRVHEDGNIVATIVTRDTPTTPTKKHHPAAATQPAPVPNAASPRSPTKKGLSPRMEKLAALPKITITCATPSPKRAQDKPPSAVSPRAVLGPSIGKQKPHQPPRSPTHSREGQQYGVRNGSEASRGRQDRARGAATAGKEATVRVVEAISPGGVNAPNETRSQYETRVEEPQPVVLPESPKRYDWSDPAPVDPTESWSYVPPPPSQPEQPSKTVECATTEPAARHDLTPSDEPGTKKTDDSTGAADVSKPKHKVKPSYLREENVENLSWDVLIPLEDESPQKVNPHTKSFLSFLASE
ncbi:serine/arginine repetitive matrix protein 1 isoform X1 [Anopheles arabiensis]|uniref:Uncharacterized protein n=2 Tax=Anopheles arabiensis TaxID=7173 RepID=A0A182I6K2_ANOAR|nr:serine/arginine repetitive matrix protein 1 isoform X1 [Anopheles arabiensis]